MRVDQLLIWDIMVTIPRQPRLPRMLRVRAKTNLHFGASPKPITAAIVRQDSTAAYQILTRILLQKALNML